MNTKYLATILAVIIIVAAIAGYFAYAGTFSQNSTSPTTTTAPTPTICPSPTTPGSPSPGSTPIPTSTNTPTSSSSPTNNGSPTVLTVFIASSLYSIVANMTQAFDAANNCVVLVDSESSSALYTKITTGVHCDVFMSADTKWIQQLNNSALLNNNNYVNFTTNSLEMIIAQGNPKGITSMADLAKPGVKVVLADPSIPSGSYTNTTCYKIDSTWGNPSSPAYISNGSYLNYNATMHQNVVSYELTVENVVGRVSLNVGTADAGIVFVSDAVYGKLSGSQVQFLPLPASVNTRGTYGIGVIKGTSQAGLAQKFMDFWSATEGQAMLTYYGFNS